MPASYIRAYLGSESGHLQLCVLAMCLSALTTEPLRVSAEHGVLQEVDLVLLCSGLTCSRAGTLKVVGKGGNLCALSSVPVISEHCGLGSLGLDGAMFIKPTDIFFVLSLI